jgi:hypothetical protein
MITVKPVTDKKLKHDFLLAPHVVHAGDPHWVAPLFLERDEHLDPRKNPYFEHAEVQLFVAYRDGKPVGRISAQDDRLRLETHKDNKGMFGFFDAVDEPGERRKRLAEGAGPHGHDWTLQLFHQ